MWERLKRPPSPDANEIWGDPNRSYCIGVSGRGQIALERMGCVDQVLSYCKTVNGRMDWSPQNPEGKETISNKQYATQVIQRDRLVAALLKEVEEKYADAVTVTHGVQCVSCEWTGAGGAILTRQPTECRSDEHKSGDEDDDLAFAGAFFSLFPDVAVAASTITGRSCFGRSSFCCCCF